MSKSDGITLSGNTLQNCHYGISLFPSDDSIVSGNTLIGNVAHHIGLDNSDNNLVSANNIVGATMGTEDCAIRFSSGSTGNVIDGNTITMATSDSWSTPLLYVIYVQGDVGSGDNTIKNNTISGGKRGIQIDGGNSGTTTIANNIINNSPTGPNYPIWGIGINGGSAVISDNTLTNTVRPVEFWDAINVTISDNTIDGSTFDGINCGSASGAITISGNIIYNLSDWQFAVHGQVGADNILIDNNEMYNSYRGIGIESGCTGVSITNNDIYDNGWAAMELHETVTTITGNTLINNWRGIETWSPITAHNNNILFHQYGGVILHHAGPHNATCNWWGSSSGPNVDGSGPGTGTSIVTNGNSVEYVPWLLGSAPDAECFDYNWHDGFEEIASCAVNAKNHGQFVSCVSHLTKDWLKGGLITAEDKAAITKWAAKSDIGKK